jgi:outer membrane receptor for ferrienterochelin and colicin
VSPVLDPAVRYDNHGKGRAYGGEFLLKHDPGKHFYGWVAYTLARSERRESGQDEYRPADYDQTHNLNIVGQYRFNPKWELGARFRFVTGNPYTPIDGSQFDSDTDAYTPAYGAVNSARNAAFAQLDVRVDRHFVFDTWKLTAYLDVQNITNRQNPEAHSYNFDYSQSKVSAGLPLIPSFGIRGDF